MSKHITKIILQRVTLYLKLRANLALLFISRMNIIQANEMTMKRQRRNMHMNHA